MSPSDKTALRDRFEAEARRDRVAKILRRFDGLAPHEALEQIDSNWGWFKAWSIALGIGATCPSHEVRHAVREAVRARLPELYLLTPEDRKLLEEMERARDLGAQP
jgi:hypothetical protein